MKAELEIGQITTDYEAVEKGLDKNGQLIVEAGEELFVIHCKLVVTKKEGMDVLKKSEQWKLPITL